MLTSSIVGGMLVLLVVLSEGASGFLWQDTGGALRFYCPSCDLRYTKFEVRGAFTRVCPFGHATTTAKEFSWRTTLITACITFIVSAIVMVSVGFVR